MDEIVVQVVKYGDRKNLVMRYTDPMTGKHVARSTGTSKQRDAERAAAKWEAELREGRYHKASRTSWEDFRTKYEDEVLAGLADETDKKVGTVFNQVEAILSPRRVADLTTARLSYFQSQLRKSGIAEDTIKSYLAHLKAALGHATRWGIIPKVPHIDMPKRASGAGKAKGRPITGEEFERMLAALPGVLAVGKKNPKPASPEVVESWRHFLRGLWLSGLRLAESLDLYWDRPNMLMVDLSGKYPVLIIPAALEKGHTDRELPMAPEFAEFLAETPEDERHGPIFNPLTRDGRGRRISADQAGRVITEIGEAAKVVVNRAWKRDAEGKKVEAVKYASAHDLRRSFGDRWAPRVMPQVLKELMRHAAIETTLRYYVSRNAQSTAAVLWDAHNATSAPSNNSGNNGPEEESRVDVTSGRGGT